MSKRLSLLLLVLGLTFNFSFGQNSHNVLKIMGIPISGTYNSFVSQLAKRKFKKTNIGWEGKFNGEDVVLHISTTPISRTVYQVGVMYKQGLKKYQAVKKCETLRTIIARKYNTNFVYNENSGYHLVEDYFARIFNKNQLIGIININAYASFLSDYGVNLIYMNTKGFQLNKKEENQQNEYIDDSNF